MDAAQEAPSDTRSEASGPSLHPRPGGRFAEDLERALREHLVAADEARLDPAWSAVHAAVLEFSLRPAKRLRPWLLFVGYGLGAPGERPPAGLWRFAVGIEALHGFMLVHDDVADRSDVRRGGPALHRTLAAFGPGEDLAVVAGDHLFARALELMLASGLPAAGRAVRAYLEVCRHTAVGQFLDLALPSRPLAAVTPFDALKVAHLKTARYSFAGPLACGATLAGAPATTVAALERAGRLAGLAFQLRDDLLAYDARGDAGKPADADLLEAKRTFPLLIAYRRAGREERRALEALGADAPPEALARARDIVRRRGVAATERAIVRAARAALRIVRSLPDASPAARAALAALLEKLTTPSR
jgi:geranylgeranyl diphosphate synthase, type I